MAMKNQPDGWLTAPEAKQLAKLANERVVLELGAFKGRSTVALAETAALVVSVDRHHGIYGDEDTFPDYLNNIREYGNVVSVIATFEQFVPYLRNIGMVYIDGDHDYESVKRDIVLVSTLEPDVVAFHDWDFPEVAQAGSEAFGTPDGVVGSVAWYTA